MAQREPLPEDPAKAAPASTAQGRVVALTGAASFLGRNMVGVLEEDARTARIICIDIKAPDTSGPKTRMYPVDLTAPSAEERVSEILAAKHVDTLLHLGFLSSPTHAIAWAHELESVGTMHVLNAARQVNLRKFILWSHTILYGAHPTNPNFLSERHPLRADADEPFFADKIAAEREVLAYAAKARGTVTTILRTAPIVGPTVHNYITRYLAERIRDDPREAFAGEVTGLVGAGAFVRFGELYEGFLPARTLAMDYYELGPLEVSLIGRTSGHAIRLGDRVDVRIDRIDAPRGRVTLDPATGTGAR